LKNESKKTDVESQHSAKRYISALYKVAAISIIGGWRGKIA
jgi:hypothetical protein